MWRERENQHHDINEKCGKRMKNMKSVERAGKSEIMKLASDRCGKSKLMEQAERAGK